MRVLNEKIKVQNNMDIQLLLNFAAAPKKKVFVCLFFNYLLFVCLLLAEVHVPILPSCF